MKRQAVFIALVLLVAAAAAALRLPRLTLRPMHTDEAVHASKLGEMIEGGVYRYDPVEFHGPTLNYATLPVAWLAGVRRYADLSEVLVRLVPAIFGVLVVLLVLGVGDGLGRPAAVCAAVLAAVSTPMVFYSRYYIMEVLLVCFTFMAIVGAWRFVRSGRLGWCVLAGAGVGLMHATKETWAFVPAAMAAALAVSAAWASWVDRQPLRLRCHVLNWRIAVAAGVAVVVAAALFSSFMANPRGPWDSILAYVHGLRRAAGGAGEEAGNLHVNPWYFYLRRIVYFRCGRGPIWTEGLIAGLALVGTVAAFARRGLGRADARLVRLLAVYSFVLLAIYSAVPYKTPWCLLGAHHGLILVAGVGAVALVRWARPLPLRVLVAVLLAAATGQLLWQAHRANFKLYDRNNNPWVYGHALREVVRLGKRAEAIAAIDPAGHNMRINVFTPDAYDQWPLPWYLRRFNQDNVGYYTRVPDDPDAAMIIFKPEMWKQLAGKLKDKYQYEHRGLRPTVVLVVGIRKDLWDAYIERMKAARPVRKSGP